MGAAAAGKRGLTPAQVGLCFTACAVIYMALFSKPGYSGGAGNEEVARLRQRYLVAVRDSIAGVHLATPSVVPKQHHSTAELEQEVYNAEKRARGNDWPLFGLSMAGVRRLDNLRDLLEDVIRRNVPGSFVECGVWRGGASLYAKAVLDAHGAQGREVHLVDSFQGLPPNTTGQDKPWWSEMDYLRVSREEVLDGFRRFGLLDESVHTHKGFFRYSLPAWRAEDSGPIAVLRMDGDMYESTMDQLYNLWDSISVGGYVIIDDWTIPVCQQAVNEFFERHGLSYKVHAIDDFGGYFRKEKETRADMDWYLQFNSSRSMDDAVASGQ